MSVIARWCFRHRLVVIAAWVVVLTGLSILAQAIKSDYNNSFSLPGTGSATAQNLLARAVPAHAGDQDTIVWRVSHGTVREAVVMARITGVLRQVAATPEVASVTSPYAAARRRPDQPRRAHRLRHGQFAAQASKLAKADVTRVVSTAEAARAPGLQVELGGPAIENAQQTPVSVITAVGVLAAAVVLFIAFGSLLAMLLPLVDRDRRAGRGLMAIAPLTHVMSIPSIAPMLGALIGLGVGIDYALFIVTRHRRGLQAGLSPGEAAVTGARTPPAGRCCSPAPRCASRCSACSCSGSAS